MPFHSCHRRRLLSIRVSHLRLGRTTDHLRISSVEWNVQVGRGFDETTLFSAESPIGPARQFLIQCIILSDCGFKNKRHGRRPHRRIRTCSRWVICHRRGRPYRRRRYRLCCGETEVVGREGIGRQQLSVERNVRKRISQCSAFFARFHHHVMHPCAETPGVICATHPATRLCSRPSWESAT